MKSAKSKAFIGGLVAITVVVGVIYFTNKSRLNLFDDKTACTLDAKMCPDGSYVGRVAPNCEFAKCPVISIVSNYKDANYLIDGYVVKLSNGFSEVEAAPGSALKVTTKYFGNEAREDFDSDGDEDIAFLLTQDNGGSGTFYYVVVALKNISGYQGINAVLLGDRIAPQTTEFRQGEIVVNFAKRKEREAMTTKPSVGTSKYFTVNGGVLFESQ